jgi:ribosome-binding protein aMBF1 (putative translation factor)
MPNPQFVPSIRDSETVTCRHCNRRQWPSDGNCKCCLRSLDVDYVAYKLDDQLDPRTEDHSRQVARSIGDLLRSLRNRRGICQSQLAKMALGIDRSYLSRAECGRVLLPLSKLLPLARALGLKEVILRFEATNRPSVPKSSCRR